MEVERFEFVQPESIQEMFFSFEVVDSATMKSDMQTVRSYLRDDNVRMVGIWGTGGVGKTTLLKEINNSFLDEESLEFDYVIYVDCKRNDTVKNLQSDLATRLELELPSSNNVQSAADSISKFLDQKSFLLLIDDLWQAVDLRDVGIPVLSNGQHKHKVVITMRSEDVVARMTTRPDKWIRVNCLGRDEAMDLFKQTVGEAIHKHPALPILAEDVVKKCAYLPKAIADIGYTLSTKRTPQEWEYILRVMTKPESTFFPDKEITAVMTPIAPNVDYEQIGPLQPHHSMPNSQPSIHSCAAEQPSSKMMQESSGANENVDYEQIGPLHPHHNMPNSQPSIHSCAAEQPISDMMWESSSASKKKKMVVKLSLVDAKKRAKALKAAGRMHGVFSASLEGDLMTVNGDGFDAVELTMMLRQRLGFAEIVSVGTVDKKQESGSEAMSKPHPYLSVVPENSYQSLCSIM